ncbi:MAG: hypothetical protein K1X74_14460 [Pirellulales bacterium]|nr:hypothetical protein [Pirellulales bacterium]
MPCEFALVPTARFIDGALTGAAVRWAAAPRVAGLRRATVRGLRREAAVFDRELRAGRADLQVVRGCEFA